MSISNKVILIGRLTKEPELKQTQNGVSVLNFGIAVNRPYNKENDHPQADFFNCVAWRERADFISKWFKKGDEIRLCGRLENRSYEAQDGTKRTVTEVMVDEVEFGQKRKEASGDAAPQQEAQKSVPAPKPTQQSVEEMDDELPF